MHKSVRMFIGSNDDLPNILRSIIDWLYQIQKSIMSISIENEGNITSVIVTYDVECDIKYLEKQDCKECKEKDIL